MTIRTNVRGAFMGEFERRANGMFTKKLEVVEQVMQDILMDAANQMEEIIRSEGVHNTVPNGDGRVRSGAMARAVDFDVRVRGNRVIGRVGWLPNDPRRERYFEWQNDGTLNLGRPSGDPDPRRSSGDAGPYTPRGIMPLLAAQRVHDEAADKIRAALIRKK